MTASQESTNTENEMLFEKALERPGERSATNPVTPSRLVPLPPRPETRLLGMIRDKILFVLGTETEDVKDVDLFITWPLPFSWDNNKMVNLDPDTERSSETGIT